MKDTILTEKVLAFLSGILPNYDFPSGGGVTIPTELEWELVELFLKGGPASPYCVQQLRSSLGRNDAYSLAIFAIRMASHSVYLKNINVIEASFWALLADNDLLDWRDVLVGLSIIEDCVIRLGGSFSSIVDNNIQLATARRTKTIREGYMPRTPEMRHVETMGYKAVFDKQGALRYWKI